MESRGGAVESLLILFSSLASMLSGQEERDCLVGGTNRGSQLPEPKNER